MKILITGGAGFIGSHITDAYIQLGHKVAVVDNLSTGNPGFINRKAHFFNLSIQDAGLADVFRHFTPDIVNHHAAHINLRQSVINPIMDAENNIIGTLNILQNAVAYKTRKLIFSSTGGAIYGEPEILPVPETVTPFPLSPYGAAKLSIEHYIRIWKHLHELDYTIFRYPNVYGPRQNPRGEAGVVAIFSLQILGSVIPTIYGDGTKTRDYLYVSDVVDANIAALNQADNETLNLGWGKEISDQSVFDTIAEKLDYFHQANYSVPRPGEVDRIALNANRAAQVMNWRPKVHFREGIDKAVRYYVDKKEDYKENHDRKKPC